MALDDIKTTPKPGEAEDNASATLTVFRLKQQRAQIFSNLRQSLLRVSENVFKNPTVPTAKILEKLGVDAKVLFEEHASLVAALAEKDPTLIADLEKVVRPIRFNDDGSAVLI